MKDSLVVLEVYEYENIRYRGHPCTVVQGLVLEAGLSAADFTLIIRSKRKDVVKLRLEDHRLFPMLSRNLDVILRFLDLRENT